jgi:hypothetical protein
MAPVERDENATRDEGANADTWQVEAPSRRMAIETKEIMVIVADWFVGRDNLCLQGDNAGNRNDRNFDEVTRR